MISVLKWPLGTNTAINRGTVLWPQGNITNWLWERKLYLRHTHWNKGNGESPRCPGTPDELEGTSTSEDCKAKRTSSFLSRLPGLHLCYNWDLLVFSSGGYPCQTPCRGLPSLDSQKLLHFHSPPPNLPFHYLIFNILYLITSYSPLALHVTTT